MKAHSYLSLSNNPSSSHTVGGRNQWIKQSDHKLGTHQNFKQHARRGETRRHAARNCEGGRGWWWTLGCGLCLDFQVKTRKLIFFNRFSFIFFMYNCVFFSIFINHHQKLIFIFIVNLILRPFPTCCSFS
jgi:hypothetical protein